MNDPRERIPATDEYLRELGRATYNFAYLEWGIVWLTESLEKGFLSKASKLTAGQIADGFIQASNRTDDDVPDKLDLVTLSKNFKELVEDRNRLMHGNPYTAEGGEQRLLYAGKHGRKEWTIDRMAEFSDGVSLASVEVSRLLHGG